MVTNLAAASALLASVGTRALSPTIDILWKPDGSGDVKTWAEVMTVVRGVAKPIRIFVQPGSGVYSIPVGTYELHNSVLEQITVGAYAMIECADGVVLSNLGGVNGCALRLRPTVDPALVFTPSAGGPVVLNIGYNGLIENAGSVPALEIANGQGVLLVNADGAGFSALSTAPLIHCAAGCVLAMITLLGTGAVNLPASTITGSPPIPLEVVHGGSAPTFPNFTGWTGNPEENTATTTQGGSGPTAYRPIGTIPVGCTYFDTDLNEAVWWDGASWITGGGMAGVTNVTGTLPIVSSGGGTPDISINAATPLAAGSMSATDKAKLDGITIDGVTVTAPITSTGGTTPDIGITPATITDAGSMSAADKAKLDGITIDGVTVTAPITSTGGATPDIGITAATQTDPGSLSAADKTKLDSLLLSGNTADRPVAAPTGTMYFDTDLGLPVWWTGATWVSAAGLVA